MDDRSSSFEDIVDAYLAYLQVWTVTCSSLLYLAVNIMIKFQFLSPINCFFIFSLKRI